MDLYIYYHVLGFYRSRNTTAIKFSGPHNYLTVCRSTTNLLYRNSLYYVVSQITDALRVISQTSPLEYSLDALRVKKHH